MCVRVHRPNAKKLSRSSCCHARSKRIGNASLPPTPRPLAAHSPLQSELIYCTNWHPSHPPQKCFSNLTPSPVPSIFRVAGRGLVMEEPPDRTDLLRLRDGEHLGLLLYTLFWGGNTLIRENNVFTWCFFVRGRQRTEVLHTYRRAHTLAEVQWLCSLTSCPLDTHVCLHLSCALCRTSSRSHCVFQS